MPFKTPEIKIFKNEKICWSYHHFAHVYQKSKSYDVWFLTHGVRLKEFFCHFGSFFALLPHPDDPENQNFEKMKKTPEDVIILEMCTINDSHMMYGS